MADIYWECAEAANRFFTDNWRILMKYWKAARDDLRADPKDPSKPLNAFLMLLQKPLRNSPQDLDTSASSILGDSLVALISTVDSEVALDIFESKETHTLSPESLATLHFFERLSRHSQDGFLYLVSNYADLCMRHQTLFPTHNADFNFPIKMLSFYLSKSQTLDKDANYYPLARCFFSSEADRWIGWRGGFSLREARRITAARAFVKYLQYVERWMAQGGESSEESQKMIRHARTRLFDLAKKGVYLADQDSDFWIFKQILLGCHTSSMDPKPMGQDLTNVMDKPPTFYQIGYVNLMRALRTELVNSGCSEAEVKVKFLKALQWPFTSTCAFQEDDWARKALFYYYRVFCQFLMVIPEEDYAKASYAGLLEMLIEGGETLLDHLKTVWEADRSFCDDQHFSSEVDSRWRKSLENLRALFVVEEEELRRKEMPSAREQSFEEPESLLQQTVIPIRHNMPFGSPPISDTETSPHGKLLRWPLSTGAKKRAPRESFDRDRLRSDFARKKVDQQYEERRLKSPEPSPKKPRPAISFFDQVKQAPDSVLLDDVMMKDDSRDYSTQGGDDVTEPKILITQEDGHDQTGIAKSESMKDVPKITQRPPGRPRGFSAFVYSSGQTESDANVRSCVSSESSSSQQSRASESQKAEDKAFFDRRGGRSGRASSPPLDMEREIEEQREKQKELLRKAL